MERHRRRLTQHDVAQKAGMRKATVSRAENGRGSFDVFAAIAAALDMSLTLSEPEAV